MTKKKLFLSLFVFMLAIGLGFSSFSWIGSGSASGATTMSTPASTTENISVAVKNRESGADLSSTGSGTFDGIAYTQYDWHDLSYFEIKATSLPEEQKVDDKWDYSIEVQFLKGKPKEGGTFQGSDEPMLLQEIKTGSATTVEEVNGTYYVDKDSSNSAHVSFDYGNGIYRFAIRIQTYQETQPIYYSDLFYVAPDPMPQGVKPKIKHTDIHSDTTLEGDFLFSIENIQLFSDYIDQSLIRWYVSGTASNGTKYVYNKADVNAGVAGREDYFPEDEYDAWLYEATTDRTSGSKTFVLDTHGIAGEWEVFCVIYSDTPARDNSNLGQLEIVSTSRDANNPYTVRTVGDMNTSYVIWIIVAAAIVLVIGLVIIIVVSVRKEKVW